MNTITIPKKLIKEKGLILIPRKEYEILLRAVKKYAQLDKNLDEAIKEVRQGKTIGPFRSVNEIKASLEK